MELGAHFSVNTADGSKACGRAKKAKHFKYMLISHTATRVQKNHVRGLQLFSSANAKPVDHRFGLV